MDGWTEGQQTGGRTILDFFGSRTSPLTLNKIQQGFTEDGIRASIYRQTANIKQLRVKIAHLRQRLGARAEIEPRHAGPLP